MYCVFHRLQIAHVADIEFNFIGNVGHFRLKLVAHIVLFFLIARKNSNLADIGFEETVQHGIPETPRPPCYHQRFFLK